jgi:hypothetical protein
MGFRFKPWRGLSIDLGLDVALSSPGFAHGPITPPWNLFVQVAYSLFRGERTGSGRR